MRARITTSWPGSSRDINALNLHVVIRARISDLLWHLRNYKLQTTKKFIFYKIGSDPFQLTVTLLHLQHGTNDTYKRYLQ